MKGTRVLAIGAVLSILATLFTMTPAYALTDLQESYSPSYSWQGGSSRDYTGSQSYGQRYGDQSYGRRFDDRSYGQYDRQPPFSGSTSRGRGASGQSPGVTGTPQRTIVSGRVTDMTAVNLDGRQYVFAKIRADDGRTHVVNLGPGDTVDRLHLYPGDTARIRGTMARVNGRRVIMASEVQAHDQSIRNQAMRAGGMQPLQGRITRTDTWRSPQTGQTHVIGAVELRDGRQVTVDFGPQQNLRNQNVRLSTNRNVVVFAQPGRVGSRTIYWARTINLDGRQVNVQQSQQAGTRGTSGDYQQGPTEV